MHGLVVLGAMLGFAFITRRRPALIALAAILLWIFIPHVAISMVWGSTALLSKVHPATVLVLVGLYAVVLDDMSSFTRHFLRSPGTQLALGLFLIAVTIQLIFVAPSGLGFIADQIVGPLIVYELLRLGASRNPAAMKTVVYGLIGAAIAESILVLAQATIGRMVPYEQYYVSQPWFVWLGARWFGTLDHPLVLGLFLASVTFLLAEIPSVLLRFSLAIAFMGAILISQSRSALIVSAIGLVFLVVHSRIRPRQRLLMISLAIVTPIIMWSSFASSGIYSRFLDDGGSSGARRAAANEFLTQIFANFFGGGGAGYSYSFSANGNLASSLENPFMMYDLDFGLIPTLLYFGAMIWLVLRASHRSERLHFTLAVTAAIILVLSFSSIAAPSAAAVLLWTMLGLLPERMPRSERGEPPHSIWSSSLLASGMNQAQDRTNSNVDIRLSPPQKRPNRY
jgi:hypothetical protein